MALFCPTCANILLVDQQHLGSNLRFYCRSCPYVFRITEKVTRKTTFEQRKRDEVFGKEMWDGAPRTQVVCPGCGHREAFFKQMQIRSGDEPMTSFYRCCSCEKHWRED
ncbi:unnamed protein product [Vitrella brassicaformis CCMP3155]|uniref:DNA-directed RNA polymerase subunit n=1 Tax=Vitrella brassicaformis (strain CCMP3155) TaxID=1169540 RepID=A0A0G4F6P9_VITBC|nr:unnamed protein product [Vitrella brassicaformis CCMP3155]|mmetsp:Transcript_9902/g.24083  ORF Transcript_9902/g.24083 Transcript_9902/m.24083 type:complete len:109 (-) Transcript_9902:516-842(-)|eukprot:CEM08106.1 unnamed protein product [Vitrella brassicaformis CCMP3155]